MATPRRVNPSRFRSFLVALSLAVLQACGGSGSSGGGGGGGGTAPSAPTGLTAAAGNAQVMLTWTASSGATSYNVQRATTSGGSYTTLASGASTNYTDSTVTNGTTYYYVLSATNSSGTSANSTQVSATPLAPPAAPTGLSATAGNTQVALTWTASATAATYNVKRGTVSGGPYSTVSSPTATSDTDTGLTNGTTYYYVVTAVNVGGESANSTEASATPSGPTTSVNVTVDVRANRHTISPYVYGGAFPQDKPTITDSGLTVVRWGGNATSTYNWMLGTNNADNDYYFEDFAFSALNNTADASSTQFITDVKSARSVPLMTMVMLPWVAQTAENGSNGHWSFSVARDGAQCGVDPYVPDAGNGIIAGTGSCATNNPTQYLTATATDLNDTYFPLLDDHTQTCPSGTTCVYRDDWAAALATAFGSGSCPIPYTSITSCHFYDMDNEIDIWGGGGTHRDVHPLPTTYNELRDIYLTEAGKLPAWDPQAVRFGWVSCCWYYYWNSAAGDKSSHANIDFMPWWLNEIAWQDAVNGARTLDIFDVHAYPETSDTGLTPAQAQALTVNSTRDWWDPTYTSQAWFGTNNVTTNQPNPTIPFRIPRLRAWANAIYPGTPLSFTEWNFSLSTLGDTDFSTALADADTYGVLGRERMALATRWTAPSPTNPNYLALKLFTRYDGTHSFGTISVSDTNSGDPGLFSSYAAMNTAGTQVTVMVVNKDPANTAQVTFSLNGFTPTSAASYTLASTAPTTITTSSGSWSSTMNFAPYSATLLVLTGTMPGAISYDWDLNPDTIMVPAGGTVTLHPTLASGTSTLTMSSVAFDAFEGAAACSGTMTLTEPTIATGAPGTITVVAGTTPGFCHFDADASDGTVPTTQGGWIVVGTPAAGLAKTSGDAQTGTHDDPLPLPLTVTLTPGSSGGLASNACILFTTSGGSLATAADTGSVCTNSTNANTGSKIIALTNSSGVASITLTLPTTTGPVTVTAEGPYGLGHPEVSFTETSN